MIDQFYSNKSIYLPEPSSSKIIVINKQIRFLKYLTGWIIFNLLLRYRVSVNSEWARKTVEHLEDETELKEIRRRDHQVEPKKAVALDKRSRLPKKDVEEEEEEEEKDSRTELPAKKLKDKTTRWTKNL